MKELIHKKEFYNKEFQDLIELAKKDGLVFTDGKFEHEEYTFPVMEVFYIRDLTDEDRGNYQIYKEIYHINKAQYDKVFDFAEENNLKEYLISEDSHENDVFIDNILTGVVANYDCFDFEYVCFGSGGKIQIQCNEYGYSKNKQKAVDLWFSKQSVNDDFPIGYISFYMMRESEYNEAKKNRLDMLLSKHLRFN